MGLDLRLPLGLMFLTIGLLMLGYGVLTWNSPMYARSLGDNVNVLWGALMVLFGATMFLLGMRSRRRDRLHPEHPSAGRNDRPRTSH